MTDEQTRTTVIAHFVDEATGYAEVKRLTRKSLAPFGGYWVEQSE